MIEGAGSWDDIQRASDKLTSIDTRELELDFSHVSGRALGHQIVGKWGPLLSNLLLRAQLRDVPIEVIAPSQSAAAQFARSGLLFALARHGRVTAHGESRPFLTELNPWRNDWQPVAPRSTLFEIPTEIDGVDPKRMGNKVVAFLNPAPSRIDVEARENAIYPWLRDLTKSNEYMDTSTRMEILRDISTITSELLDNIRDHADSSLSYMTLWSIGSGVNQSLQMCIVDNGKGIPESVEKRHTNVEAADYLLQALNGSLPRRSRGRGDGLAKVSRTTQKYGGNILIATGPTAEGKSLLIDHDFSSSREIHAPTVENVGIIGTVVVAQLSIGKALHKSQNRSDS